MSTEAASFASAALGAMKSKSLPETGAAKLRSRETRKKSCPAGSPVVWADAVTVAEANANSRKDAVRKCQTLWLLIREGNLSRSCARQIYDKPHQRETLPRCRRCKRL